MAALSTTPEIEEMRMTRRIVVTAMAAVLSASVAPALHAAPFGMFRHTAATNAPATGKMIPFKLRNQCASPLVFKAGEQQYTIDPGKTLGLKLQEGAQLIAVSGSDKQAPGSVMATVSTVLQNNTLVIN